MYVELPSSGCNVVANSSTIYNYSSDFRKRTTYTIFEGRLYKSSESTSNVGYNNSGDCIPSDGLLYAPIYSDFVFPLTSFCLITFAFILIYNVIIKRLLP